MTLQRNGVYPEMAENQGHDNIVDVLHYPDRRRNWTLNVCCREIS